MTKLERVRVQDLALSSISLGLGVVLISAGDAALAAEAAEECAHGGADIMLLHRPADEAAALAAARRVEALGRRCELFTGELDDAEVCQEAAIHAAFFGRGAIGALLCVPTPVEGAEPLDEGDTPAAREALRQSVLGLWSLIRAALPHLAEGAQVIHLASGRSAPAASAAEGARRAAEGFARGLLAAMGEENRLRFHAVTDVAAIRREGLLPGG